MAEGRRIGLVTFASTDAEDRFRIWLSHQPDIALVFSTPMPNE